MLGIKCKWECPSCGSSITTHSPFWDESLRKKLSEPKKCSCGRVAKFKLYDFSVCQFEVIPSGYKLMKTETNTVPDEPEEIEISNKTFEQHTDDLQ